MSVKFRWTDPSQTFRPRINGPGKLISVLVDPARTALMMVSTGTVKVNQKDERTTEAIGGDDLVANMNVRYRPNCSKGRSDECSTDEE